VAGLQCHHFPHTGSGTDSRADMCTVRDMVQPTETDIPSMYEK
jgi:hypothetical protein